MQVRCPHPNILVTEKAKDVKLVLRRRGTPVARFGRENLKNGPTETVTPVGGRDGD
jgi:hypothetical protein